MAYWLPYLESLGGSGSSGGSGSYIGIGVVPSDFSSCTLTPVYTGTVTPIAELENLSFQLPSPTLTAISPYAAVFEGLNASTLDSVSLYGLPLLNSNDATFPTPTQIGSLSETVGSLCSGVHAGYANVLSPSSAFFIVQYAPSGGTCSVPTTVLINWTDSISTAPTTISGLTVGIPSTYYADLYSFPSGQLYAEVLYTGSGGDLNLYPPNSTTGTPNYSAAINLLPNVNIASVEHHPIFLNRSGQAMSSVLFDKVVVVATNSPNYLYRIDSNTIGNGAITLLYGAAGALQMSPTVSSNTSTVFDDTNIYFADVVANPNQAGGHIYNFYEVPIAGGAPVQIGTVSAPFDALYSMVDVDGTNLILEFEYLATTPTTFGLYSLSVTGSATQSPIKLLEYNGAGAAGLEAFLDYGSDHLFVNEVQSGTLSTTTSLVLAPSSSTPLLGPTPNTSFMQWLPVIAGSSTSDTVLQFQNLPSDGTDGSALLNDMTADTLMSTALSLSGSPYIVPAQNTVTLAPVSNTVGEGTQVVGTGSGLGLAINVSDSQIITIGAPADTVLSPF